MIEEESEMELLTKFCVDNKDLESLEDLLREFNIFEAAGLTREEIRHSAFLSFLLDPQGQHGLGDFLVTRVLQDALTGSSSDTLSVLDVELMDLSDIVPHREYANIDILLTSSKNSLAVIIENKIGTGEHSDQLRKYLEHVRRRYPTWAVLAVFLSPEGIEPSHEAYRPLSYESIAKILEDVMAVRRSSLSVEVTLAIDHYVKLLRRHVVNDSKLTDLCQRIIAKHRKALELLFEQMEDSGLSSREVVLKTLESHSWTLSGKSAWPTAWDTWMPQGLDGKPLVKFWVTKDRKRVELIGEIQPGDQLFRQRFFEAARRNKGVFKVNSQVLKPKYCRIISYAVADSQLTDSADFDSWQADVQDSISSFEKVQLPKIEEVLRQALSHSAGTTEGS